MTDRLEWADHTSGAELLFPGEDISEATVETGEIAIAWWTGSNGIALSGPPEQLAARLEQAAAIARAAAPLLKQPLTHLPAGLAPWEWTAPSTETDTSDDNASSGCGTPGTIVRDPRCVTCGDCITAWNACWPETYAFPTTRPIPLNPADHTLAEHLPYADITWIDADAAQDRARA